MLIKKSALRKLIYEMVLTENRRTRDWIASLPEEERQAYQDAYDAGVKIESDLRWIQKVREQEPVEDIYPDIILFRNPKVQNVLPNLRAQKDVSRYNSVGELRKILDQVQDLTKEKIDYTEAFQSETNVRKIATVGKWTILMPLTVRGSSSCDISGKDTVWCTTKRKGQNLFYSYVGRYHDDIILFYIMDYSRKPLDPYKRQDTAGVEDNDSRLCVGYINGRPHLEGETGGISVDAANIGLVKEDLKRILGSDYKAIKNVLKKTSKDIAGKHPAKQVMEKASENPALLRHLIKDYGADETIDFFNGMLNYGLSGNVLEVVFEKCKKFHDKFINKSKTDYEQFIVKLFDFFENIPQSSARKGFAQTRNFYCNKIMEEHFFRVFDYYEEGYSETGTMRRYSNYMDPEVSESIEMLYEAIIKNADLSHDVQTKVIKYGNESGYDLIINQLLEDSDDMEFISGHVINNLLSGEKGESSVLRSYRFVQSALKNWSIRGEYYDPDHLSDTQKQAASRMVSAIFEKYIANQSVEKNTDVFRRLRPDTAKGFRLNLIKQISSIHVTSPDILDEIFNMLNDTPREDRYEEKEYAEVIDIFTKNLNLGPQTIQKIIECDDPVLRSELALGSTSLTDQQFRQLARDPFYDVRLGVAKNALTPTEVLESLVTANTAISYTMFDNRDGSRSGRLADMDPKEISAAVVKNSNCSLRAMIRAHQLHRSYIGSLGPKILFNFGVAMMEMSQSKVQVAILEKLAEFNTTGKPVGAVGARSFEEIAGDRYDELIEELKERFRIPENLEFSRWYRTTHFRESFYWFYKHQEPNQVLQTREGKPAVPLPREVWSYDNVDVVPEISYRAFLDARGQEQAQYRVIRKGQ